MDEGTVRGEMSDAAARGEEAGSEHEQNHGSDFADGEDVLNEAAEPYTKIVDGGEHNDERGGETFDTDVFEGGDVTDEWKVNGPESQGTGKLGQFDVLGCV